MRSSSASLDKFHESTAPLRVVVADDHALLRQGVVSMLQVQGFEVVAQASDAEDVVRKVNARRPDVAIVDIRMPPNGTDDGLRAAIAIRHAHPEIGVLVLSQYVEAEYAVELIGDDARGVGYLLKDRIGDFEEFADALREVADGGTVLDPEVVHSCSAAACHSAWRLTAREREVLALVAEGWSNGAIAADWWSASPQWRNTDFILSKLDLPAEPATHRRVLAVLAFLEDARAVTSRA